MGGPQMMLTVLLFITLAELSRSLETVYMTERCGSVVSDLPTARIETSRSLISRHNINCVLTVKMADDRTIMMDFRRFNLEIPLGDVCVDYLNVFDGDSTSSPRLNPDVLCGEKLPWKYETSGPAFTLHYVTDSSAASNGFDVIYSARKKAPCDATHFPCNNSYCVDIDQVCNGFDQCGDGSDETGCQEKTEDEKTATIGVGLIIGLCTAGVVIVIISVIVCVIIYKNVTWKKFLQEHEIGPMEWEVEDAKAREQAVHYPITQEYSKHKQRIKKKTKTKAKVNTDKTNEFRYSPELYPSSDYDRNSVKTDIN